ncbi:MAG: MaoC/PaaZ C-terminal domain-containing protein [Acidobacteriota bacterium]
MRKIAFDDLPGLRSQVSDQFGEWGEELLVPQTMINEFAEVTGDHQWIHTDVERAEAESPFGATIAHGFLTLSLLPRLAPPLPFEIVGHGNATIFGLDSVRFVRPVPAGARIRGRHRLTGVRSFVAGTLLQSETQIGVVGVARAAVRFELKTLYQAPQAAED